MVENLFSENELNGFNQKKKEPISKKVRFKPYNIGENDLFPPTADEYIEKHHIARLISLLVDRLDMDIILENYKGGGTSSYNPRMMLKVWLLGFVYRIYTSRKLAQALAENLAFIWISGKQKPDFRTLSNFRQKLKGEIKSIFKQVVQYGLELGIIQGKDIFVDHTKLEANANRHKIVWRKQVDRQLNRIDEELEILFQHIDTLNEEEDKKYGNANISETDESSFDIEKINKLVNHLNTEIKKKRKNKESVEELKDSRAKLRRTLELLERRCTYNLKKQVLGDRNSFSKTDPTATAMLQKDKISIVPGYNEGIAVENCFVLDYVVSDKSADSVSFIELMDGVKTNLGFAAENTHTDGAYGSEENSAYLESEGINNFLKFNTYRKEKSKKWHREKVRKEDFSYDSVNDTYRCPNGSNLSFQEERISKTATGYETKARIYKAAETDCANCPHKTYCTTGICRSIQISLEYERYKEIMRQNLATPKGKELRSRRGFEVEGPFGDRKFNNKFGRYVLRDMEKIEVESGFYYIGHNIKKMYNYLLKNWFNYLNTNRNVATMLT